jgi:uncharacterized membrane protein YdbT with pleckstrin-like domain
MTSLYPSRLKQFLLPNEQLVYITNPHWLFLFVSLGQIFFFFILYYFVICPFLGLIANPFKNCCYLVSLFILIFVDLVFFLDWRFDRLYLTNLRIIRERGIIGKRYMSIRLADIEDIACIYGTIGRFLGYGDLIIESAGKQGVIVFKRISRPNKVRLLIDLERREKDSNYSPSMRRTS